MYALKLTNESIERYFHSNLEKYNVSLDNSKILFFVSNVMPFN